MFPWIVHLYIVNLWLGLFPDTVSLFWYYDYCSLFFICILGTYWIKSMSFRDETLWVRWQWYRHANVYVKIPDNIHLMYKSICDTFTVILLTLLIRKIISFSLTIYKNCKNQVQMNVSLRTFNFHTYTILVAHIFPYVKHIPVQIEWLRIHFSQNVHNVIMLYLCTWFFWFYYVYLWFFWIHNLYSHIGISWKTSCLTCNSLTYSLFPNY